MKPDKQLVILTTHFGTNFSGGSTATCEIFSRIQREFDGVVVVGTELGNHPFERLKFLRYRNWWHALRLLKSIPQKSSVFYGDFYNSFLFGWAGLPFYFTYHDNWPEMAAFSFRNKLKSLFYTSCYQYIFKRTAFAFLVSRSKEAFASRFTSAYCIVKNGFTRGPQKQAEHSDQRILMVGTVDKRKYQLALQLFEKLPSSFQIPVEIYGHIRDQKLADALSQFAFVKLMGFHEEVPYADYSLLLHTSQMENLPLVFCEAIDQNVPVLCFDVGGSREIVTAHNGALIPDYDLDKMARVMKELLSGKTRFSMDKSVLEQHSWEKAAEQYQLKMTGS